MYCTTPDHLHDRVDQKLFAINSYLDLDCVLGLGSNRVMNHEAWRTTKEAIMIQRSHYDTKKPL